MAIRTSIATVICSILIVFSPAMAGPALLYDPVRDEVLFEEDLDKPWYPASLAKLMTAYLAFETVKSGRIGWEDKLTLSDYARGQPATRINLRRGIDPTINEAVHGLILRSANDLAVALAEALDGSEAAFVARMNATAKRLGMTRTMFANPHGLPDAEKPEAQVTTARDMAILAKALLRDYPDRAEIFATRSTRIYRGTFYSQNDLIVTLPGGDGMKTGYTCGAGYNVVASATRGGQKLIAVVFGSPNRVDRSNRAADLLEAGFAAKGIKPPPPVPLPRAPALTASAAPLAVDTRALRRPKSEVAASTSEDGAAVVDEQPVVPTRRIQPIALPKPRPLADITVQPLDVLAASDVSRQIRIRKCARPDRPVGKVKSSSEAGSQ